MNQYELDILEEDLMDASERFKRHSTIDNRIAMQEATKRYREALEQFHKEREVADD